MVMATNLLETRRTLSPQVGIVARFFLGYLTILLLGYAVFGRGFAYLGVPPVYVGEIGLVIGIAVMLTHILVPVWESRLVWGLVAFMIWGFFNTLPYVGTYGMDALRDGAQWGYAVYALAVATAILQTGQLDTLLRRYVAFARLFLLFVVPWLLIFRLAGDVIPRLPWGPDYGGVQLLPKGGDIAVHLTGIAVLIVLGLGVKRLRGWIWLVFWIAAAMLVAVGGRASFLTLAIPALVLMLLRPGGRWHRLVVIVLCGFSVLVLFDIQIGVGREGLPFSAETLFLGVASIFGDTELVQFSATKEWRLMWWDTIIDYTILGEHFWTGKGFGINLATDDGFHVSWNRYLRSPHNGHLTILARAGVPGFFLWIVLQGSFALALFRAYRSDRRKGRHYWADLALWILLYWLAFMVNASFDVYLEGPQGGIWFWSVFGFGLAHLIRRRMVLVESNAALAGGLGPHGRLKP